MKNIRYVYTFHFHGRGIDTEVEIKAETLKELYFKLVDFEPALDRLADRAWNCACVEIRKRSIFTVRNCHRHTGGFSPHDLMSEREINFVKTGKHINA